MVHRCISDAIDNHVPKARNRDHNEPPWLDSEARHLVNKKRTLWREVKKKNTEYLWGQFRVLHNRIKTVMHEKHERYNRNLGNTCVNNPKRFWSYFRSVAKSKSLSNLLTDGTNYECHEPREKASLSNDYFCNVFYH